MCALDEAVGRGKASCECKAFPGPENYRFLFSAAIHLVNTTWAANMSREELPVAISAESDQRGALVTAILLPFCYPSEWQF